MVYQILTDRLARSDGSTAPCPDWQTYCGGTWKGITNNLDYIQGLGADAIYISPVVKQVPGAYHGYYPLDYFSLNPHFGTADDLKAMVDECHRRGMLVMVDVTANAMGHYWSDIPTFGPPFNDTSMFHHCDRCIAAGGSKGVLGRGCNENRSLCDCWVQDYNNLEQCLHCQLFGMPDVNTEHPKALAATLRYVKELVETYQFDAIRVDAMPYLPFSFWKKFVKSAAVFSLGEVSSGDNVVVSNYIQHKVVESVVNYPLYYRLRNDFALPKAHGEESGADYRWGLDSLRTMREEQECMYGSSNALLVNFVGNQDTRRLGNLTEHIELRKAMIIVIMTNIGSPMIYYGDEQDFVEPDKVFGKWHLGKYYRDDSTRYRMPLWETPTPLTITNEGMYGFIRKLGLLRKRVPQEHFVDAVTVTFNSQQWLQSVEIYGRGKVLVALCSGGPHNPPVEVSVSLSSMHDMNEGTIMCDIFSRTDEGCSKVRKNGEFIVSLKGGESKVYVPLEYAKDLTQ
jgi:alpha-amylase